MADSLKLVSGGEDIKIWDWPQLRLVHTFKPHSQPLTALTWSPNNNFLASTAPGESVVVTSFNKPIPSSVELSGCEGDTCVAFNSSSRHLLTAGKDKILNFWDLKTRSIKKKIKNHSDVINCVTFNWNDTTIASGTAGGDILLHSVSTTQTSSPLRLPQTQTIHAIQYSRFKKALLGAVSDDGALNIWDTNTKKIVVSFSDQHTAPAMDLSFSPMNDMLLASVGLDKRIIFYDILGKKVIKDMPTESPLTSVSFMQDGAAFAVGTTRGKILIYDLRSGSTPLHSTMAHKTAVHCVSFQLRTKGSASSSTTLAEKFSNRSSSDSSAKRGGPPPLPPGIPGEALPHKPASDLVQNGVKHDEGSAIFSPLREGSTATVRNDVKADDHYEDMNFKRSETTTTAGIFSPINNANQPYDPASGKSTDRNPASLMNGHFPVPSSDTGEAPRVKRQAGSVALPTSQLFEKSPSSSASHLAGNSSIAQHKETLNRRVSVERETVNTDGRIKPLPRIFQSQGDLKTVRKIIQENDNGISMGSTGLTDSPDAANGFAQSGSSNRESSSGFREFQIQFMKNLIDDSLDEFRTNFHEDIVNLQVEMLRQFQIQQNEMKALLQQYSLNDALVAENQKLREEIRRLKSTH